VHAWACRFFAIAYQLQPLTARPPAQAGDGMLEARALLVLIAEMFGPQPSFAAKPPAPVADGKRAELWDSASLARLAEQ